MTVELNCSSVPNFLKSSNLYKNFEFNGDESIFTIPQKYLVNEIKIWMSRYDEIIKSKKLNKLTTFLHENYFSCNGLKRVLFDGK